MSKSMFESRKQSNRSSGFSSNIYDSAKKISPQKKKPVHKNEGKMCSVSVVAKPTKNVKKSVKKA